MKRGKKTVNCFGVTMMGESSLCRKTMTCAIVRIKMTTNKTMNKETKTLKINQKVIDFNSLLILHFCLF